MPKTKPKAPAKPAPVSTDGIRVTVIGTVHPERLLAARLILFGVPPAEADRRARDAYAAKNEKANKLKEGEKR